MYLKAFASKSNLRAICRSKFTPAFSLQKLPCCSFSFEYSVPSGTVSQGITGSFLSLRCLIFKVLSLACFACELFYSITSASLCQVLFKIFFKIFFVFDSLRFRDSHIIISHRVRFVKNFFHLFSRFFVPASLRRFPSASSFPSIGRLSAAFFAPSLCDSFTILPHLSPFVKLFLTEFLCLLIVLYLSYPLLTIGTNIILLFSTAITTGILFTLRYYILCNGIPYIY